MSEQKRSFVHVPVVELGLSPDASKEDVATALRAHLGDVAFSEGGPRIDQVRVPMTSAETERFKRGLAVSSARVRERILASKEKTKA